MMREAFEGTLVLEQLARIDKVDEFMDAVDAEDVARAAATTELDGQVDPTIAKVGKAIGAEWRRVKLAITAQQRRERAEFRQIDRQIAKEHGSYGALIERQAQDDPSVQKLRGEELFKLPGVAETLDWAATLAGLEVHDLRAEPEAVRETMIALTATPRLSERLRRAFQTARRPAGESA